MEGKSIESVLKGVDFPESREPQQKSLDWILDLIYKMEKKSIVPINAYKEIVRFLLAKFDNLVYINNELKAIEVRCRYGNPERTIARLNGEDNIILPLITVSQDSIVEADGRRRNASNLINTSYWDEEKQRAIRVVGLCDRPVTINYSINLWAKYMEDLDQLSQKIRLAFNPALTLNTKFSRNSQVFLESETNNYSFSLADREDRVLRKSFTASVETYVRSPRYLITSTGEIEQLNVEAAIY
jgi:hypothetical protein